MKSRALVEGRGIFEALRSRRHDPEIRGCVVDHRGDDAPEAQIEPQLDGHEHDGKDDADDGRDEAQPVVQQVARCESVNQRHGECSAWACVQSTTFGAFAARSAVHPRTGRKSGEIAVRTEIFADHGGIATESVSVRDASGLRCTGAP